MLKELFGLYLQGLLLSSLLVALCVGYWFARRVAQKLDQTAQKRQKTLYEAILMCLVTIPILAFAIMAVLLMLRA